MPIQPNRALTTIALTATAWLVSPPNPTHAQVTTITWNGGCSADPDNHWYHTCGSGTETNWDTNGIPQTHDNVFIPASAGSTTVRNTAGSTAIIPDNDGNLQFYSLGDVDINTVNSLAPLRVEAGDLGGFDVDGDLILNSTTEPSMIHHLEVDGGVLRLATSAGDINDNALTLPNGGLLTNGGQIDPIDFNPPGGKIINLGLFETFTEPAGGPRSRISIDEFENQGTVSMTGAGINVGFSSTFINKANKLWTVNVQELTGGGNLFLNPLIAPRFINEQDATLDVTTANGAEAAVISMVNDQGNIILHTNSVLLVGTGNAADPDRPERRSEFNGGTVQLAHYSKLVVGISDFFPAQLIWTGGATAITNAQEASEESIGEVVVVEFATLTMLRDDVAPINTFDRVRLRNHGTTNLVSDLFPDLAATALLLKNEAYVVNEVTGTINIENASISAPAGEETEFTTVDNQGGTINFKNNTVSAINVPLHISNGGVVNVLSGQVFIGDQSAERNPNAHLASGFFNIEEFARLELVTRNWFDGTSFDFSGLGTLVIGSESGNNDGSIEVSSGTVVLDMIEGLGPLPGGVTLYGSIAGSDQGAVHNDGIIDSRAGRIGNLTNTDLGEIFILEHSFRPADPTVITGTVINQGLITQGSTLMLDDGTIEIHPAGRYEIRGNVNVLNNGQPFANPRIRVAGGELKKNSDDGTSSIDVQVDLSDGGTVKVDPSSDPNAQNILELTSGGSGTGAGQFVAGENAFLSLDAGTFTFDGDFSASGNGVFTLGSPNGGSQAFLQVTGGTFTTSMTGPGQFIFGPANQLGGGDAAVVINGQGRFVNTGPVDWLSGTISDTGGGFHHAGQGESNLFLIREVFSTPRTLNGRFIIEQDSVVDHTGDTLDLVGGTIHNKGTYRLGGQITSTSADNILNEGLFKLAQAAATRSIDASFDNPGTVEVVGSSTLNLNGPIAQLSGTVLSGGRWLVGAAGAINLNDAPITHNSAFVEIFGNGLVANLPTVQGIDFTNNGTLALRLGTNFTADQAFNQNGTLIVDDTSDATITGAFTADGDSTTIIHGTLAAGSINLAGGLVGGTGTIVAALVDNTGGQVAPGSSAGKLTIDGDYTASADARHDIELGGLIPETEHDQLDVTGAATIHGAVLIKPIDDFTPAVGNTFDIATADTITTNLALIPLTGPMYDAAVVSIPDNRQALRLTAAQGAEYTGIPGLWDDGLNWSTGELPDADDRLLIRIDTTAATVQGPAAATTVDTLVIGDAASAHATTLTLGNGDITATTAAIIRATGQLTGTGHLIADTYNAGTLTPGTSPGTINITGDYTQLDTATLEIELAGTTPDTEHDVVAVTGAAALAGTLDLELINNYEDTIIPSDTFVIMTYATNNGTTTFDTHDFNAPTIPGLTLTPTYNSNNLTLTATALDGDANLDGVVDLDDLVTLAANFDTVVTERDWRLANFDHDTDVDADDLNLMAANFAGNPDTLVAIADSLGVQLTQLPEPATATTFLLLSMTRQLRRRSTRAAAHCPTTA